MAAADTAKLVAALTLDARGFNAGVKSATGSLGKLESTVGNIGRRAQAGIGALGKNLALIGVGAGAAIAVAVKSGLSDLSKLNSAIVSVDSAIASVGATGQITGKEVAKWANDIEADIGAAFDDKDITAAAATLLRFGKVAPKNLKPALVVMTDLATKTGDIDSAASLLAKALADPTKAAGKLARQGIILTKAQQDTIKAMVKQNDIAGAQEVILDTLSKTTSGAAAASQDKYARSLSILNDVAEDARKALAEGFLPVIEKVADLLSKQLRNPAFLQGIRDFGTTLAGGLDDLISVAQRLPWGAIGDSLKIAGAGAKAVLNAFVSLPPWVQTAVLTGWGLNKLTGGALGGIVGELGKGLIKGVLGMNAGVVNINAGVVNGVGGGVPGAAPAAAAGGLTAGAVATTAAVGVVLVGGTVVSLNKIAEEAGKNNLLAAQGLTQQEIIAQKYYSANKADQETIFKRLGGQIPPVSAFESGNAKLQGKLAEVAANVANGGKLQNVTNERLEAIRTEQAKVVAANLAGNAALEKGTTNTVSAAERTAAAVKFAGTSQVAATTTAQQAINAAVGRSASLLSADSRSEQAAVARAATTTAAATATAGNKAAAAGNVVATAVRNKKTSVTIPIHITQNTRISVANDLNAKNNYKSVYNVAI